MSELAKVICVEGGPNAKLIVDGEEFPWHVAMGVTVEVDQAQCPGVTLKILAERVEVVDDMGAMVSDD